MTGTSRPLDSGRKDALGRTVRVAEGATESRADAPAPTAGPQFDDDTIASIVARRNNGIDCTEDESAAILDYFDTHHPEFTDDGAELARLFPVEHDQWAEEVELGDRPRSDPATPPPVMKQLGIGTKYGTLALSLTRTGPTSAEGHLNAQHLTNRGRHMRTRSISTPNIRIENGQVSIDRGCIEKEFKDPRWPGIKDWKVAYREPTVDKMIVDIEDEIGKLVGRADWDDTVDALTRGQARAEADMAMQWQVESRLRSVREARKALADAEADYESVLNDIRYNLAESGLDGDTIDQMVARSEQDAIARLDR